MYLEPLTKMAVESAPADHCIRQMYQRLVNVIALLVAYAQPAEPLLPANRPLDHPAVAAQPHAALDPAPRDTWRDASLSQCDSQRPIVIRLVGVQLRGSLARATALATHRPDRIHRLKHLLAIVDVRPGERDGERDAFAVYHLMAFRARFAAVRRARADGSPFLRGAPLARTLTESMLARLQSSWPACSKRLNSSRCNLRQTPARCQSRSLRQQVIPEPQPISRGSISQGKPLRRTKRMPVSAARSESRGRPRVLVRSGGGGRSGSITFPRSSATNLL